MLRNLSYRGGKVVRNSSRKGPWVVRTDIVSQIANGAPFDEILKGYPDLEREDIQQAIEYAAWLAQEQVYTR